MIKVFNFSGGKTSALMVIKYYEPGDLVLFTDTGREHAKTYKFINDFEAFENIPVIRISISKVAEIQGEERSKKDAFRYLLEKKKYKCLPNRVKRFCTDGLKIKTSKRFLRLIGVKKFENYLGFRADEPLRVKRREQKFKNVFDKFPLYEDGTTKAQVNEYWSKKPYNLEIPSILGNCTLCFMKGKNAIISILITYPELAEPWIEDERLSNGHTYLEGTTIKELLHVAQNNLFKNTNLNELEPAFNCACTA